MSNPFTKALTAWVLCTTMLLTTFPRVARPDSDLIIPRIDSSPLRVVLQGVPDHSRLPVLLAIAGSGCWPSTVENWIQALASEPIRKGRYVLVIVEKPEPTPVTPDVQGNIRIEPDFSCSTNFKKYYSLDTRVEDHLRVLQYLRKHARWWNGDLRIWGFSDGGHVGARVAAYTTETRRVALVGVGGGLPMAQTLASTGECAARPVAERENCLTVQAQQFELMRKMPTGERSYHGDDNTWRTWASRLDAVESNVLVDLKVPILVVHGELDRSVSVESARKLARDMENPTAPPFHYLEVQGMGHSIYSQTPEQAQALLNRILNWVLARNGQF